MIKCYSDLIRLPTFEQRFAYLRIGGTPGRSTFGYDRYLNQVLYHSGEWRSFRKDLIIRDNGCDLALPGRDIYSGLVVHHINPITSEDIELCRDCVFDPENTICTADITHKAIHFGDESLLSILPPERRRGDTDLWTAFSRQ